MGFSSPVFVFPKTTNDLKVLKKPGLGTLLLIHVRSQLKVYNTAPRGFKGS
jgi:hypothetical protein